MSWLHEDAGKELVAMVVNRSSPVSLRGAGLLCGSFYVGSEKAESPAFASVSLSDTLW